MKKLARKGLSLVLSAVMVFSIAGTSLAALAAGNAEDDAVIAEYDSGIQVNPVYEDSVDIRNGIRTMADTGDPWPDGEPEIVEYNEVSSVLKEAIKNREDTVFVQINGYTPATKDESDADWDYFFNTAVTHTGQPDEGDYLRWSVLGYEYNCATAGYGNVQLYTQYVFRLYYGDDAEQEVYVANRVPEILDELGISSMTSDHDKISAIYDWVCENVTYDYDHLDDTGYWLKYTAYAALADGKSVCQGYALLMYYMLLSEGIDCRFIAGDGYNGSASESHGWNIARIDDLYYNLDSTWDSSLVQAGYDYEYFLTGANGNFDTTHIRYDEYDTDAFKAEYPMYGRDYYDYKDGGEPDAYTVWTLDGTVIYDSSRDGSMNLPDGEYSVQLYFKETLRPGYKYTCRIAWPDDCTAETDVTGGVLYNGNTDVGIWTIGSGGLITIHIYEDAPETGMPGVIGFTVSVSDSSAELHEHVYGEPTFNWSSDYSECMAVFECTDGDYIQEVACEVTSDITPADCGHDGLAVYCAECEFEGLPWSAAREVTIPATGEHVWDNGVVTIPATDTADGEILYTCTVCGAERTEPIPATDHIYEDPEFEWSDDHTSCEAVFTCTECGDSWKITCDIQSEVIIQPTCVERGEMTVTAVCIFNGEEYRSGSETVYMNTANHTWGDMVIISEASMDAEAEVLFTCTVCGAEKPVTIPAVNDSEFEDTPCIDEDDEGWNVFIHWEETAGDPLMWCYFYNLDTDESIGWCKAEVTPNGTYEPATCEHGTITGYDGYLVYDTENGPRYILSSVEYDDGEAAGHTYGTPGFVWSDDGTDRIVLYAITEDEVSCEAVFTCAVCGHRETIDCENIVPAGQTEPGCETPGTITYEASVEFEGETYTSTYSYIYEDALGHKFSADDYTFDWCTGEDGGIECDILFPCQRDGCDYTAVISCDVTVEDCLEPTCAENGYDDYKAVYAYSDEYEWSDHLMVVIDRLGHEWGEPVFDWSGFDFETGEGVVTAVITCVRGCEETAECTVTAEADGNNIIYTAAAEFDSGIYEDIAVYEKDETAVKTTDNNNNGDDTAAGSGDSNDSGTTGKERGTDTGTETAGTVDYSGKTSDTESPKTGDTASVTACIVIIAALAAAGSVVVIRKRKGTV